LKNKVGLYPYALAREDLLVGRVLALNTKLALTTKMSLFQIDYRQTKPYRKIFIRLNRWWNMALVAVVRYVEKHLGVRRNKKLSD
jgi:hypothetical protein